ncbi:MAG: ice-binding family protein [Candidatus Paceibacterota bacterium]
MNKMNKKLITLITISTLIFGFMGPISVLAASPAVVNLGSAGNFSILSKTAITTTGVTAITGDIGVSPAAASTMTGFSLVLDASGTYAISVLVTGKVYASSYTAPTPSYVGTAVSAMEAAYTDANSRATDVLNAGLGDLAGLNLVTGVYTFDGAGNVIITDDVTLTGSATDVWIFQIPGTLNISAGKKILLGGAAQAKNIFWAVAGATTLEPGSIFEGNILGGPGASTIAGQNGAVLHGRALGQTDVTLIGNTVSGEAIVSPQLTIVKSVVNNNGGGRSVGNFPLFIDGIAVSSGSANTVSVGAHVISETYDAGYYVQSFSGNCLSGTITLVSGDNETCTITNDDIAVISSSSSGGGGSTRYGCNDPKASNYDYFSASNPALCVYTGITQTSPVAPVTPLVVASLIPYPTTVFSPLTTYTTHTTFVPNFPYAGFAPQSKSILENITFVLGVLLFISVSSYAIVRVRSL